VAFYGTAEGSVEVDFVGVEGKGAEAEEERGGGVEGVCECWAVGGCLS
jgi:hypothetical protein